MIFSDAKRKKKKTKTRPFKTKTVQKGTVLSPSKHRKGGRRSSFVGGEMAVCSNGLKV